MCGYCGDSGRGGGGVRGWGLSSNDGGGKGYVWLYFLWLLRGGRLWCELGLGMDRI